MRSHTYYQRLAGMILIPLLIMQGAIAQTKRTGDAKLRVAVTDATGSFIVAAQVQMDVDGKPQTYQTDEHGRLLITLLKPGAYHLHVEAEGFNPKDIDDVNLVAGDNQIQVQMELVAIKEQMKVEVDQREKATDPNGSGFATVLTKDQLAQLPDDPDELEATLRRMGGPGAIIRVNGFRGGKLPPKSQIQEIRFRRNPYAAENHEAGVVSVDIYTKPGLDDWHGTLSVAVRNQALNARNALAPQRGSEQYRRFGFDLGGPLWRDHTSLFLSAEGGPSADSRTIVAALPDGPFTDVIRTPSRMLNASLRLEHLLTPANVLRFSFQRHARRNDNLGIGDFDLSDRAYSTNSVENLLRVSVSGPLTSRLVNELRFQARWQDIDSQPVNDTPAILVLNAFNRGGAQFHSNRTLRNFEVEDGMDFAVEQHAMKAGFLLEGGTYHTSDFQNTNGTFTFASLDAFRAGQPTTFVQRVGAPTVAYSQYRFGWFLQDDIRVRKNLSLSLGLRGEIQNHLSDRVNFAPRAGIAWSPFENGKTTFRAGAGFFYDWFTPELYEQTQLVDGQRQHDIVVLNPGFPNPFVSGTPVALPPSRYQQDSAMRMPYLFMTSFGVERELAKNLQFMGIYVYQRGVHLLRSHNINAPFPGLGRPDPNAGNIIQIESTANSTFRILSLNLSYLGSRTQIFVSYNRTQVKNEVDSPFSFPSNNYDLRADFGSSLLDTRDSVLVLMNWKLPHHMRLGTFFYDDSALPYNITTGFDNNGDTINNDRPQGVGRNSARGRVRWDLSTRLGWTFGIGKSKGASAGRPRPVAVSAQTNASVLGSFAASDMPNGRFLVELYVQAYNLFNHANLTNFSGVQTSPFFGVPTAALPPRRIETGVKFSF